MVGAGPGAGDLITLRGLKALQLADVVLHDALVSDDLLAHIPEKTIKLPVGKRAGHHSSRQEDINQLMVNLALSHGHVVRLKGGDPFVFGRGQEELAFAHAWGIAVEVIPGISTCIALPELQQVPVTSRGFSESFWVITGTTQQGILSRDIALAAQSTATVVILMGLKKLPEIMDLFLQNTSEDLPAMVILNGSLPTEQRVIGTVGTLVEKMKQLKTQGAPGIIVVGKVVALHPDWAVEQALAKNFQMVA